MASHFQNELKIEPLCLSYQKQALQEIQQLRESIELMTHQCCFLTHTVAQLQRQKEINAQQIELIQESPGQTLKKDEAEKWKKKQGVNWQRVRIIKDEEERVRVKKDVRRVSIQFVPSFNRMKEERESG